MKFVDSALSSPISNQHTLSNSQVSTGFFTGTWNTQKIKMEAEIQGLAEITVKVDESRIAEFQKLAEEFGVQHISIKADFGASTPKNPKVEFGTPPKSPNVDLGTHFMMSNTDFEPPTPSSSNNIDGNISKSADGAICTCNVCGKILSCMSSARRHYKSTHEVMLTLFLDIIHINTEKSFSLCNS